jgi:integrase
VNQPERYWLPLILLMSGMRLNEAAGLRVSDVREVEGALCFDVNEEGERALKNANSQRLIPVHPILGELKFKEYVEGLRKAGAARLFPNLKQKGGSFGVAFSRWWGRYSREWITKNPKKSLHSARGSFVTSLLNAGVEEPLVKALVGHSASGETAGRYMKGYEPRILLSAISRLSYGREVEEELRKLPSLS